MIMKSGWFSWIYIGSLSFISFIISAISMPNIHSVYHICHVLGGMIFYLAVPLLAATIAKCFKWSFITVLNYWMVWLTPFYPAIAW